MFDNLRVALPEAGFALIAVLGAAVLGWLVHFALFKLLARLASLSESTADELVIEQVRRPMRWAMIALAITMAAQFDATLAALWEPLAVFLRPALLGWIAYTLVKALTAALEARLEENSDPVAARSRRTRIAVLSRIAGVAIVVITVGLMLMGVPGVRDIGTTMLASAGLAALAVGAAAQPALKSLIGGLQLALTEPLRIGDLVVVDGHTGRVEEIRMSFIVIRTWDERAVIVPTARVLENSFENWSRRNEMLTGPVFLHLDPATEIEPVRAEFLRFLATRKEWDGRTGTLLMTEAQSQSVQLRLAMSAATIASLFDLRCAVREHMIGWLRREMPDALIRPRMEIEGTAGV